MTTVTVRDQAGADALIPEALAKGPIHLRIEPMEGPIEILEFVGTIRSRSITIPSGIQANLTRRVVAPPKILTVTVSGGDKPIHPDWVRKVRDQCEAAGVPFALKWGEWLPADCVPIGDDRRLCPGVYVDFKGQTYPEDGPVPMSTYRILSVGRERSGRTLDGVIHEGDDSSRGGFTPHSTPEAREMSDRFQPDPMLKPAFRVLKVRTGTAPNGDVYGWIEDATDLEDYCYSVRNGSRPTQDTMLGILIGELSCSGTVDLKACGVDYEGNEPIPSWVYEQVAINDSP